MFFYQHQDNFMFNFHTGGIILYIGSLVFLASVLTHPLYLAALLSSVVAVAYASHCLRQMKTYFLIAMPMVLLIMIINPLLSREGKTIIWEGPLLPVLGKLEISLEAILYGGNMGMKLAVIIGAFGLFNLLVDPDKFLSFCSRYVKKSAITISLTTRMLPNMAKRLREIKDVYRTRGVNLSKGSKLQRLKLLPPLIKVLLLSSLEDTFKVAESMQARGFGSAQRSCYSREKYKPRDGILYVAVFMVLTAGVLALIKGWGTYIFYPLLAPVNWDSGALFLYILIVFLLLVPVFLTLGCERWPSMKYKI